MHGKTSSSNVNQYLSGVYYIPSQHSEVSPWYNLSNRLGRLRKVLATPHVDSGQAIIGVGDCASIPIGDKSIDYIFTDPPFGENIYYADLNFLVEAWHGVMTATANEAIVDRAKKKGLNEYQELMKRCFKEYHRVLKPGRSG